MTNAEFLRTAGKRPWRLKVPSKKSVQGIVYDADNRLVCVCAVGNAKEIVAAVNYCHGLDVEGKEEETDDPITVCLRAIDVLEGRQKLGNEAMKNG